MRAWQTCVSIAVIFIEDLLSFVATKRNDKSAQPFLFSPSRFSFGDAARLLLLFDSGLYVHGFGSDGLRDPVRHLLRQGARRIAASVNGEDLASLRDQEVGRHGLGLKCLPAF